MTGSSRIGAPRQEDSEGGLPGQLELDLGTDGQLRFRTLVLSSAEGSK